MKKEEIFKAAKRLRDVRDETLNLAYAIEILGVIGDPPKEKREEIFRVSKKLWEIKGEIQNLVWAVEVLGKD